MFKGQEIQGKEEFGFIQGPSRAFVVTGMSENPIQVEFDSGVDAWVVLASAAFSSTNDSNGKGSRSFLANPFPKGTATVAHTSVLSTVRDFSLIFGLDFETEI